MGLFKKHQGATTSLPAQQEPGILARAAHAWNHRPRQEDQAQGARQMGAQATVANSIKTGFAVFAGGFCPFAVAVILTISAGYYFNSLRPFTGDVQSIIAYGTAAIIEAVNLALFFVSAKAFWSGKTGHFLAALLIGLGLTTISVIAQVLYLSNNLDKASIGAGAAILQLVPLFGPLANTGLIIVTRALALHVAEFACCYVIARSAVSHKKIIQAQQEAQEAEIAQLEAEQFMQFKRALHQAQMAQLQTLTQALGAPQIAPASPLQLPTLQPEESEAANNGHSTFR